MIISHKHKFIFVKSRKTAGSSIHKILQPHLGPNDIIVNDGRDGLPQQNVSSITESHAGWREIKAKYPKAWDSYYKFTIERNPWDKTVSSYYFYKNVKPKKTKNGFEAFVMSPKKWFVNDWEKYTDGGAPVVDEVIRYENLKQEFPALLERFNIPYNGELEVTSVKGSYREEKDYKKMYNDETKERVAKAFADVIEYFNYSF